MRNLSVLFLFVSTVALAESAKPTPPPASNQDAFQAWVTAWTGEQGAWVADWWSASLEENGQARDLVAKVCRTSEPSMGAYLVESAAGKRFLVRFEDDTYHDPVCDLRTQEQKVALRRSDDRYVHYSRPIKRAGSEDVWLAIRNGALVIVAEKGDASYGANSLRGDHSGKRSRELSGQVDSTFTNLHPWTGSWDRRK